MKKTFQYRAKVSRKIDARLNEWLLKCREFYKLTLEKFVTCNGYFTPEDWAEETKKVEQLAREARQQDDVDFEALNDAMKRKALFIENTLIRSLYPVNVKALKDGNYNSFTLIKGAGWELDGKNFTIHKVGKLKLFLSRPILGDIETVTVKKSATGKWFVNFHCNNVPENVLPANNREVGIDVGLLRFLTDSEGNITRNPRFSIHSQSGLEAKQKRLSQKKEGSASWKKNNLQIVKHHEKVSNQRKDFINKVVRKYVNEYGVIYIEDLNIQDMIKNEIFSRSISDTGWGMFFKRLKDAARESKREVVKVNPHNTSQLCVCGVFVKKTLDVRVHNCPSCGLSIDRDTLAAINILRFGRSHRVRAQHENHCL